MKTFDDQFANRVRTLFDAYDEPPDEAAWTRMQSALGHGTSAIATSPGRASDRPAARRDSSRRVLPTVVALGTMLLFMAGVWIALQPPDARPGAETLGSDSMADAGPQTWPGSRTDSPGDPRPSNVAQPLEVVVASRATPPQREASERDVAETRPGAAHILPDALSVPLTEAVPGERETRNNAIAPAPERASVDHPVSAPLPMITRRGTIEADATPSLLDVPQADPASMPHGLRVVAGTSVVFAGRQWAEGGSVSAGVARDWDVARGLRVTGELLVAASRIAFDPTAAEGFFLDTRVANPAHYRAEVRARSEITTLAVEVPLGLGFDVARLRRGTIGMGVGVVSALYVAQHFRDEGTRYAISPAGNLVDARPFTDREAPPALSRLDLARQLGLSVGYVPQRRGVAVEAIVRVPLADLTSRDLPLGAAGVRVGW